MFLLVFVGCEINEKPSSEKMAHLYVDILVAEEEFKNNGDSLKIAVDSLYSLYKIDEPKYLEQLESYTYDIETWDDFFSLAEVYLDTLKSIEVRKSRK
jgi:hypothetical protein